ncbi:putative deoxyribonuclease TATDN2 [Saccostrea cucullata]|uniref:putative deoxyribonuclease TATDN2 n=1 Tax=Saccostrea cuccullata TaxID=36930 RepID=UPI002ED06E3B
MVYVECSREVGHGSIAEDAGHHHNIVDCHHNLKKKPKDTAGRGVSKVSSILTEELPSKNVYIPPHKRVPNVHGQYVARENRPTNNKDISPPSSHLYQNCKETPRTWREERSHLDGSLDIGSSEVSYWRTQQNRMLSCPTTLEHNSNAHNIKKSFASMHYELHQQQDGQGQHTLTELSQSGNASEDEPSGCDLFLASSSEDSTPTSRPYRFNDQKQTMDRYPDTGTLDWRSALLERCNVYGVGYIDSHCHIDFLFNRLDFKGRWSDFRVQNMKTFPSSYLGCVAVFCNPNSFKQEGLWRSLSKEENVWLTFGCHPKNARDFTKWNLEGLRKCLLNSRVVALGEIGLDYSGVFVETKELQKSVFKKQIRMALDMRKPLVIHCREAEEDCLDILKQMVPRLYKIHCHCFTGDFTSAKLWLDYFPNLYIGLTPLVTYRTAKGARDVAKFIPLKRLLLESDAPYFVPRTIPKESMNYSHPGLCVTVAEEVARLKNISVQEVLKACLENTRDMYKI